MLQRLDRSARTAEVFLVKVEGKGGARTKSRENPRSLHGRDGMLHAKTMSSGQWLLTGSSNWTTASSGNFEESLLLEMGPDGLRRRSEFIQDVRAAATPIEQCEPTAERRRPYSARPRSRPR